LTQRSDDQPDTVAKRLQSYDDSVSGLIKYYNDQNKLVEFKGKFSKVIYKEILDNKTLSHELQSMKI